jgi:hypothetical protein
VTLERRIFAKLCGVGALKQWAQGNDVWVLKLSEFHDVNVLNLSVANHFLFGYDVLNAIFMRR